jgi:hypothetical protein
MVGVGAKVLLVGRVGDGLLQQEAVLKLVLDPLLCNHTIRTFLTRHYLILPMAWDIVVVNFSCQQAKRRRPINQKRPTCICSPGIKIFLTFFLTLHAFYLLYFPLF